MLNVYDFKDALAAVDVDSADMATLGAIVGAYNGLDKTIAANLLTSEENAKYELVVAKSEELASQTTNLTVTHNLLLLFFVERVICATRAFVLSEQCGRRVLIGHAFGLAEFFYHIIYVSYGKTFEIGFRRSKR